MQRQLRQLRQRVGDAGRTDAAKALELLDIRSLKKCWATLRSGTAGRQSRSKPALALPSCSAVRSDRTDADGITCSDRAAHDFTPAVNNVH